jgi:hypothetical protein
MSKNYDDKRCITCGRAWGEHDDKECPWGAMRRPKPVVETKPALRPGRTDTHRLDWLEKSGDLLCYAPISRGWYMETNRYTLHETPRAAIDFAMDRAFLDLVMNGKAGSPGSEENGDQRS